MGRFDDPIRHSHRRGCSGSSSVSPAPLPLQLGHNPVDPTKTALRLSKIHTYVNSYISEAILKFKPLSVIQPSLEFNDASAGPAASNEKDAPSLGFQLQQVTRKKVYGTKPARQPFFHDERVRDHDEYRKIPGPLTVPSSVTTLHCACCQHT